MAASMRAKTMFTEQSMMIVVPAGKGLHRPEPHRKSPSFPPHGSSAMLSPTQQHPLTASPTSSSSMPLLPPPHIHSLAATPETSSQYSNVSRGSSIASWTPIGTSSSYYKPQMMYGLNSAGSRNIATSDSVGMNSIPEDPPDLSSQYFRQFKPNNAPAMPSTTPLPVKVRRRRYPHATAAAELGSQPVPKPEDLERYEGPYHIIVKRLLSQAPPELREELGKVVAVVLDRCNDLEDRMLENEKRATDLNRQRMVLLQKVQTLQKLLSNSRSSLRAVGDKAKELQGEVLFRTTVINKQVESINKLSGKNLKLASALHKLNDEQLGGEPSMADEASGTLGGASSTTRMVLSETSRLGGQTLRGRQLDGGDSGPTAFSVKKEIIMTVSAVSKENLELVTKTRILDQDVRNFKEQLRVINEKLRAMHAHLEEYGERSSKDTLLRLATEALAQDPENHIKMSTMLNRQARVFELLEGENDKLGHIINDPSVDSVVTLIHFRDLVKLIGAISSSGHTDDVLRELLSRATCRLLSCEAVVLYVHDKEDSMWSMSMSTLTQRAYHSTKRSIAGHVMRTGTRVNTMTPKEHQAFDPDVDGFATLAPRSLLSIPVKDHEGRVVAVLQALNKISLGSTLTPGKEGTPPSAAAEAEQAAVPFTCVDELLVELLLAQAFTLLTNSKISTVTEWKFETCLKFLTIPGNYLRALVLDMLFPTPSAAARTQQEPDLPFIWTLKKLQQMLEEVLRAKLVRVFILDSVEQTLTCLADTVDPATCQKVKVKRVFKDDQGFAGHMAHSSGKVLVSSPQTDPRVNTEVDLDTGSDPLHTCTIQAVSGQVLAVVQVGCSSFDALNDRGNGAAPSRQHSIASLGLLDALDLVCEQVAPYLETVLQVLSPHFIFSTIQPRRNVVCASADDARELEQLRVEAEGLRQWQREHEQMQAQQATTASQQQQDAAKDNHEREALKQQIVELESGTEALKHQLTALTQQLGEAETGAKAKETEAESLRARLAETQQQMATAHQTEAALRAEVAELRSKPAPPGPKGSTAGKTPPPPSTKQAEEHRAAVEELKKQLDEQHKALEQAQAAQAHTSSELATATQQLQAAALEKATLAEQAAQARRDAEALKQRNSELEAALAASEAAAAAAGQMRMTCDSSSSCGSCGSSCSSIEMLRKEAAENHEEVARLSEELKKRRASTDGHRAAAAAEAEDLRKQVEYLKEQLAAFSQAAYYQAGDEGGAAGGEGASDWDPYTDEEGNVYYVNRVTGETSWERPGTASSSMYRTAAERLTETSDGASDGRAITALHTQDFADARGLAADDSRYTAAPDHSQSSAAVGQAEMSAASPKSRYRIDI